MKEYVIWGKAPNCESEDLLVSEKAGLRDMAAERAVALLQNKHGCRDCRIQVLDLSKPLQWDARSMLTI